MLSPITDIGQVYHGPETRGQDQELNPGPTKKIVLQGQGIKPWTYKKDCATASGDQTLAMQKHHAYKEHTIAHRLHEQASHGMYLMDDREQPDQQMIARQTKNRCQTDCLKDDASVQKDMFAAGNIFFGNTSYTSLCRFLLVSSSYRKAPLENILHDYSSCTFT